MTGQMSQKTTFQRSAKGPLAISQVCSSNKATLSTLNRVSLQLCMSRFSVHSFLDLPILVLLCFYFVSTLATFQKFSNVAGVLLIKKWTNYLDLMANANCTATVKTPDQILHYL